VLLESHEHGSAAGAFGKGDESGLGGGGSLGLICLVLGDTGDVADASVAEGGGHDELLGAL